VEPASKWLVNDVATVVHVRRHGRASRHRVCRHSSRLLSIVWSGRWARNVQYNSVAVLHTGSRPVSEDTERDCGLYSVAKSTRVWECSSLLCYGQELSTYSHTVYDILTTSVSANSTDVVFGLSSLQQATSIWSLSS